MYKHILLPIDGSPGSTRAVKEAITLAKTLDASVTCLTVIPEFGAAEAHRDFARAYGEGWTMPGTPTEEPPPLPRSADEHVERARGMAEFRLRPAMSIAKDLGVACTCTHRIGNDPYEAIIRTAQEDGCDLIAMASHGWHGIKAFVLGGETQKVLTHSTLPVLVLRYSDAPL